MKKIIAVLVITVLSVSLFAAVSSTGTLAGGYTEGNTDPFIYYEFTPGTDADSFTIGFSTKAVTDFTTVSDLASGSIEMTIADGEYVGRLPGDVYIFWQIASSHNTTITLSATAMTDKSDSNPSEDVIDVTLKTVAGSGETNVKNDGTVVGGQGVKSNGNTPATPTDPVLDYIATDFGKQCAGSQKISLVTDSIFGIDSVTYTGTITATIKARA